MANSDNASTNAIVAIGVIAILILALLYFAGVLGPRETATSPGGQTNVNIENPAKNTDRSSTIERSTERSSTERSSTERSSPSNSSSTTQTQERTTRSS
jgi:hypothetical protein